MKRLTIIAFFCVFFSMQLLAIHKLAVTEFLETNIEIDIDDIIFDDDGNDASVLNVYLDWDDVTFKGDTLSCKKATFTGTSGEGQQGYIVHMGKSPAFIYIYGDGFGYQCVDFKDYGIEKLEPGKVYDLKLEVVDFDNNKVKKGANFLYSIKSECGGKIELQHLGKTVFESSQASGQTWLSPGGYGYAVKSACTGDVLRGTFVIRSHDLYQEFDFNNKENNNDAEIAEVSGYLGTPASAKGQPTKNPTSGLKKESLQAEMKKPYDDNRDFLPEDFMPKETSGSGSTSFEGARWYLMGMELLRKGDLNGSTKCFIKSAGFGYSPGIFELAQSFYFNRGITYGNYELFYEDDKKFNYLDPEYLISHGYIKQGEDPNFKKRSSLQKSIILYKISADMGYAPAMYQLADCYQFGDGVPIDLELTKKWYEKAADLGFVPAATSAGYINSGVLGLKPDYDKSHKYAKYAADHGCIIAIGNLALHYLYGHGVEKNTPVADIYFKKAMVFNNASAMINYLRSKLYTFEGIDGNEGRWLLKTAFQKYFDDIRENSKEPWFDMFRNRFCINYTNINQFFSAFDFAKDFDKDRYIAALDTFVKDCLTDFIKKINNKSYRLYMPREPFYKFVERVEEHYPPAAEQIRASFKGFIDK